MCCGARYSSHSFFFSLSAAILIFFALNGGGGRSCLLAREREREVGLWLAHLFSPYSGCVPAAGTSAHVFSGGGLRFVARHRLSGIRAREIWRLPNGRVAPQQPTTSTTNTTTSAAVSAPSFLLHYNIPGRTLYYIYITRTANA